MQVSDAEEVSEVRLGGESAERGSLSLEAIVFMASASSIRAAAIKKQAVLIFQFMTDERAAIPDGETTKQV